MISIDDFKKLEIKTAKVLTAERVAGSDKLLRLRVDAGPEIGERQIIAGIGNQYEPENLIGKTIVVLVNLEPRILMGLESRGMILAASDGETISLLAPDKDIQLGAVIR
ncbi:MAG: Methionyl-tRNA synthetase, beta subunit [Parcubacteria group bacterium GW2011_GWB1_52_7]|nr:MAG: Methionyl-tRNA synthetase, beta subunit [Parcubacteria group bacterium GW2011_GWA1_51_12]KKW29082.1 MAG: Methionyl-tRNA synthetase, beta subunit [Parcubacteria group bacterium GW2011_GWB1_52_7]KKW30533.1 MAG: Methionyl-tRNA synthetase, beta subunit [Parcubacteria group bacterium GW2011_GWC2_52_8c]